MGGKRYLISWILMLLFFAGSVPVLSGCDKGSDSSKSSDEDDDKKKKKKKKKKKSDDDEEEEEEEEDDDKKKKKKKKKSSDDDDGGKQAGNDDKPTEVPPAPAPPPLPVVDPSPKNLLADAVYKRIPTTNLEVPVPKGWKEDKKGLYSGVASPDGKVVIAFTVVTYKSELAGRIQDIERKFGITNEKKTGEKTTTIGPNKLKALIHDATCSFHGKPGKLSYVIVQQKGGRRSVVLVIYASENDANRRDDEMAHAAVLNIR